MGKYSNHYANSNFGDHDLDPEYQGVEKIEMLRCIANELAEANRLKRIEISSKFVEAEIRTTPGNLERLEKDLKDQA